MDSIFHANQHPGGDIDKTNALFLAGEVAGDRFTQQPRSCRVIVDLTHRSDGRDSPFDRLELKVVVNFEVDIFFIGERYPPVVADPLRGVREDPRERIYVPPDYFLLG